MTVLDRVYISFHFFLVRNNLYDIFFGFLYGSGLMHLTEIENIEIPLEFP